MNLLKIKLIPFFYLCLLTSRAFCQDPSHAFKMEVPRITLGENQNYQVLSFEPLGPDQCSILYLQELSATIVGDREFRSDKTLGAFLDQEGKKFVNHSDRVVFLVRQTFNKTAEATTNFWVIATRELQSDMRYTMFYPPNFVHPIIKDEVAVKSSLKNLDQIEGLSPREFEALVLLGKQKYGFYKYPEVAVSGKAANLVDEIQYLKSGFKELKAVLGKGDIPPAEKLLFKREVVGKIRLAATKIDKKDSVQVKLYLASNEDAHYELLKSQTFSGSISPNFSSALVYDESLQVAGAYGYALLKYKDASGTAKATALAMGIDNNGEPQFWRVEAGKNSLNSFLPWFSYMSEEGLFVVSHNNEKVFKPYYQHHLLKKDGTTTLLYPTNAAETNSDKNQFLRTEQAKSISSGSYQFSTNTSEAFPVGIVQLNKSRFLLTGVKTSNNDGATVVTSYGNLSVMRLDGENKIRESYEILENKSADMVYPRTLGQYDDQAFFLLNYPNKFKLVLSENKVETQPLENDIYRLVYMANADYVSTNQFGSMLLTKSIVGNKYTLEFFPSNAASRNSAEATKR